MSEEIESGSRESHSRKEHFDLDKVRDTLAKYSIDVGYATPESLADVLPSGRFVVRSSLNPTPDYDSSTGFEQKYKEDDSTYLISVTTEQNPAVLYEFSVYYCAVVLTFDKKGNAVVVHQPFGNMHSDVGAESDPDFAKAIADYKYGLSKLEEGEQLTLVTGANTSQDERDYVVDLVEREFQSEERQRVSLFGDLGSRDTQIGQVVYIPPYLSRTGRGSLLFASRNQNKEEVTGILFPHAGKQET